MKLTSELVERTLTQIDAQAIPDNHPVVPQLNRIFGDHTYFLDGNGLSIVEPAEPAAGEVQEANLVKLASWSDENRTSLAPHEPQPTEVVVNLGSGPDRAA